MDGKKDFKKLTPTNTKQEMLLAYNSVLKELEEKQSGELKPEKRIEGASNSKSVASLQQLLGEQIRKQAPDK